MYPGLVVHGPMQATLLIDAAQRHGRAKPARYRYRGVHPMFAGEAVRLVGKADGDTAMELCTATTEGYQGMQARIEWA